MDEEFNASIPRTENLFMNTVNAGDIIIVSLMVTVNIVAIIGNLSVIIVVLKQHQLRYCIANIFIIHLCIVDLLGACWLLPVSISAFVVQSWPFSDALCLVSGFFSTFVISSTILNMCVISIERFYSIKMPMHYTGNMTKNKSVLFIFGIWIFSAFISILPLIGWNSYEFDFDKKHCSYIWNSDGNHKEYVLLVVSVCFFIPSAIIIVMYCGIFRVAKNASTQVQPHPMIRLAATSSSVTGSFSTESECKSSDDSQANIVRHFPFKNNLLLGRAYIKALRTLMIIVMVYLVLWGPYFCLQLIMSFAKTDIDHKFWELLVTWMGYVSFAANPFIYGWMNRSIREELLQCKKCGGQTNEPDIRNEMQSIENLFEVITNANRTMKTDSPCNFHVNKGPTVIN